MQITSLIAYAITIAIPLLAVYVIFALDLYGTGKESTILTCLGWGAIGAFSLALILNKQALRITSNYESVVGFYGPIIEEILKAIILIYFIQRPRFRYVVDGAIYGFAVGIGFSVTENMYYLADPLHASLGLSISRVLSSSLMHATASALVGISFGRLRRSESSLKFLWTIFEIAIAMALHIFFNNVVNLRQINATALLLLAIGIGTGGSALIAFLITSSLREEQAKFRETLGLAVGVTGRERNAVQQVGSDSYEKVMASLGDQFGREKEEMLRRLLALQANVGILRNNLASGQVSDRLRAAWEDEIKTSREEMEILRRNIGVYVMSYYRNVFPSDNADDETAQLFRKQLAVADPNHVHSFDMFSVNVSLTPNEQANIAETLKKIDIFKEVDLAELENLSRAIQRRTYSDGATLFTQGDAGDKLYLIEDGSIQIFSRKPGDTDEQLLNTTGPGEAVGELALLDNFPRSATARSRGTLKVFELKRDQFKAFIQSRPTVIMAILTYLAQRVRFSTDMVETKIAWAHSIARGDYDEAKRLGNTALSTAQAGTGTGRVSIRSKDELEDVIPDTNAVLNSMFSRASSVLVQRNSMIAGGKGLQDLSATKLSTANLTHLPDRPSNKSISTTTTAQNSEQQTEKPSKPGGLGLFSRVRATGTQPEVIPPEKDQKPSSETPSEVAKPASYGLTGWSNLAGLPSDEKPSRSDSIEPSNGDELEDSSKQKE